MTASEIRDWDAAYHNSGAIPGAEHYPALWAAQAAIYRAKADFAELDIPYGDRPRQRFDLFHPDSRAKGLAVFVHGGYWMAFDKSSWSHLADGARRNGWAVALPSYTLAPEARIGEITVEIGRAIETAAARVEGPIRLAGHSAGGHLVARMMCQGSPIAERAAARIEHVLSISGLHELHPLMRTRMNETLRLDEAEAERESPSRFRPRAGIDLCCWVGGGELPEFQRQSELLAETWGEMGVQAKLVRDGSLHHFDVIRGLADPTTPITRAFAE